jgi:glycosyltransferase involved in cell wall biosynthesis
MRRRNVIVAFAITPNKIGGLESFCRELAEQLKPKKRHLILCFEDSPSPAVRDYLLEPGNVTLETFPSQAAINLKSAARFYRLLRKYRPEIVLYSLGGVVRLWPLLARAHGVSRSVYYDGTSRPQSMVEYRASALIRTLMKPLGQSICATEFVKECSDREGIVPPNKSKVIYNAIDIKREHGDGALFRQKYGIPEDRLLVLKVSWLVPEKGIDITLLASREALRQRKDLHFVFCGDGEHREAYERTAAELGIAAYVTWTGQVEDLPASGAFQAADMQIQCSQWREAFCLAVAEGASAGLPVVVSRVGGLPELVTDGVNGFLFEPQDHVALANYILKLAGDESLRLRMGQAGRKRMVQRHDLTKNVAKWVEAILPTNELSTV